MSQDGLLNLETLILGYAVLISIFSFFGSKKLYLNDHSCREDFCLSLLVYWTHYPRLSHYHVHPLSPDFPNFPHIIILYCTLLEKKRWFHPYITLKVLCKITTHLSNQEHIFSLPKHSSPTVLSSYFEYFLISWLALSFTVTCDQTFPSGSQFSSLYT